MSIRTAKLLGATCASRGVKAEKDTAMACSKCGKVLMIIPAGEFYFEQFYGDHCDCDWHCCEFSKAGAQKHGLHIGFATVVDDN